MAAKGRLYAAAAIITGFLLLATAAVVYAGETLRVARIAEFSGEVKIMKAGGEKVFPAFQGMGLVQGDRIITAKNSTLTLEIDGAEKVVKIAENSNLLISELVESADGEEERSGFSLWAGGIWSDLKKKLTSGSRFEIKTSTAVMGARGTKIYVSQVGDKTVYSVLAGSAYVSATVNIPEPGGGYRQVEVELLLDQQQQIETKGTIGDPDAVPIQEVTLRSLDLFVLEIIKELAATDPASFDPGFLEQLDEVMEEKREEAGQLEEEEEEDPEPLIEYDSNVQQDNSGTDDSGSGDDSPPPSPVFTVSFEVDGGSGVASQLVNNNGKAGRPADPAKAGHTFTGWYTDIAFTTEFDFANTLITADITIYAKWVAALLPAATLTADTTENEAGNVLEITFAYDEAWVESVTGVKVSHSELAGELELDEDEDYVLENMEDGSGGCLTLYPGEPGEGRLCLQKAGTLTVLVEAAGYETSQVEQVILPGPLEPVECGVAVGSLLEPDRTSTITVTARDRYGNPIGGHQFYLEIQTWAAAPEAEYTYTIDGSIYEPGDCHECVPLQNTTNEQGEVTFQITIPEESSLSVEDGFTINVIPGPGEEPIDLIEFIFIPIT